MLESASDRIYGSGLGEKPSIRKIGVSFPAESGGTYVLASVTDASKIKAGQILSSFGATQESEAWVAQVVDVSGSNVELVLTGGSAPAGTVNLAQHGAPVTERTILRAIGDIVDNYLYPQVYDIDTTTFTPDLSIGQSEADAAVEEVLRAWQEFGGREHQIGISLTKNLDSSQFASGKMYSYSALTGVDVAVSTVSRVTLAGSTDTRLEELIAKGAAALVIEGTAASQDWEYAKNDARERGGDTSRSLWSSFYTSKQLIADDLSRNRVTEVVVDRG